VILKYFKIGIQIFLIGLLCVSASFETVVAQGSNFNQRDDQYRLLGLKRAKEAYDVAKDDFDRQKQLFDQQMISSQELEQSRNRMADAEVNYQQSLLAVLFEQQYITVTSAIKYQTKDNRKGVRVTIENASGGSAEYRKLINLDDELFNSLQPDIINNVYVSITNDAGAIISQPYEMKISQLFYDKPQTLNFGLLEDLDAVTVNLIYGSGTQRAAKIFLQKDASEDRVIVQSQQFSQEAELSGSATYAMTLELFSGRNNTFKLEVVNLPQQVNRYFVDPVSSARLNQFQFNESANTRRANLEVFLPDRPTETVPMDEPIDFFVIVIPQDRVAELGDVQQKQWTAEELTRMGIGYLQLELIPRGTGRLLVRARQLFQTVNLGDPVSFNVEMVNEGSRRLDNVEIDADVPLNWQKSFNPKVINRLEIGSEERIDMVFTPPADVSPGKYEIRVRTRSVSNNQPVNGEDKTFTIEIKPASNILLTGFLFVLIAGLVIGIVYFGIRLTRR
jgi:uncharacterized membrane protein